MKEKVNSAKLKGTVLYTVVSVLMVLIVFLMGTMALAATASNRAYTNYQKEQTEYTARLLLDSVVEAINADTSGTGIKSQMVTQLKNKGNSFEVDVQLEGVTHKVKISNVGKQTLYNQDDEEWVEGVVYEVAAVSSKLLADTTYCAYIVGEHEVVMNTTGGGGAFVSMGDIAGGEIGTGGLITGGTFIGVGNPVDNYKLGLSGESIIDAPFFLNGNAECGEAIYLHFMNPGDYFIVSGDLTTDSNGGIFPVFDGYNWDAGATQSYEKLPYIYVGGTYTINTTEIPGHELRHGNDKKNPLGNRQNPVNIYCGELKVDKETGLNLYGDVYCFDPNSESEIGSGATNSKLYSWTAHTLQMKDATQATLGNWYSMGSVTLKGNNLVEIEGDLRVEKDVTLKSGKVTIHGDLVCGGTLSADVSTNLEVKGNIYAGSIQNAGNLKCDGTIHTFTNGIGGTVNCPNPVAVYDTTGMVPTSVSRVWHDNVSISVNPGPGADKGKLSYTYTRWRDENGNRTEEVVPYETQTWWFNTDAANGGYTDYLDFLTRDTTAAEALEYQKIKAMEATQGEAFATTEYTYSISTVYGDIYPEAFTRQNLDVSRGGFVEYPTPSDYRDAGYPTDISKLGADVYDASTGKLRFDPWNDEYLAANCLENNGTPSDQKDDWYEITTSCEITGPINRNLYIKPTSDPITVILNGVTMTESAGGKTQIIIEDSKQVTLFIRGEVTLVSGNIITADYMRAFYGDSWKPGTRADNIYANALDDSAMNPTLAHKEPGTLTIWQNGTTSDWWYPNVVIYGEVGSKLTMSTNESLVTAQIRAPQMVFNQRQGSTFKGKINIKYISTGEMEYGDKSKYTNKASTLGVVGQLIAGQISMESAKDWGMLYITNSGAVTPCTCGCGTCTSANPSTCTCNCGTPGCICSGGTPSGRIPTRFTTLYYNYY